MNNLKNQKKIKFGIMCSNTVFPIWRALTIEKLLSSENIELSLIIINGNPSSSKNRDSIVKNIFSRLFLNKYLLLNLYNRISVNNISTVQLIDISESFSDIPTIICKTKKRGKFSEYFYEKDLDVISKHNLDFILRFGFGIIRGDILKVPKYGVWSFHHGDEKKYRGQPSCFWEIYNNELTTGAILQRLTNKLDGGVILKKGIYRTINHSLGKNKEQIYSDCVSWPLLVCNDIKNGAADYIFDTPSETNSPIFFKPNNWQSFIFILKIIKNKYLLFLSIMSRSDWNIGIIEKPIEYFLTQNESPKINWLKRTNDRFIADPFIYKNNGKKYIIYEEKYYSNQNAHISIAELGDNYELKKPKIIIKEKHHLSYPFIFENEGKIYCIPESAEANSINLYSAYSFPEKWKKVGTLLSDVSARDSTLVHYNGLWWLFFTQGKKTSSLHLCIFYSSKLNGPYKPHTSNPVKTDIRSARPAGPLFKYKNCLYRPAQNCSKTSGGSITLNKIIRLTPNHFSEKIINMINPELNHPYTKGIHTISGSDQITVVDGKRIKMNIFRGLRKTFKYFTNSFSQLIKKL